MKYGVNIPVREKGFLTAQEIIELHEDVLKEKGCVYFSTSGRINPKKADELDYLLLSNKFGIRILCEIVSYDYFPDKGVPSDSVEYSPKKFADVPENHWFKVSTMENADSNYIGHLIPLNERMKKEYSNVENYINGTGRIQVFYFRK